MRACNVRAAQKQHRQTRWSETVEAADEDEDPGCREGDEEGEKREFRAGRHCSSCG